MSSVMGASVEIVAAKATEMCPEIGPRPQDASYIPTETYGRAGLEFNQQIDIAVRTGVPPETRSEQRKALDPVPLAQLLKPLLVDFQAREYHEVNASTRYSLPTPWPVRSRKTLNPPSGTARTVPPGNLLMVVAPAFAARGAACRGTPAGRT